MKFYEECVFCGRSFTTRRSFHGHLTSHIGEKAYDCEICGTAFGSREILVGHVRRHTGEKRFQCSLCEKRFWGTADLKRHQLTHSGQREFKCELCKRSFLTKPSLYAHLRTHTGESYEKCEICNKTFKNGGYATHKHVHSKVKVRPCKCTVCGISFRTNGDLQRHLPIHSSKFKCHLCDAGYQTRGSLTCHIQDQHDPDYTFTSECIFCGKVFLGTRARPNLYEHLRTHTKERPNFCKLCPMEFAHSSGLASHTKTRNPNRKRNFHCKTFEKTYTTEKSLKRHTVIHSNDKPSQLSTCDAKFKLQKDLSEHIKFVHATKKPFRCRKCRKNFKSKRNLSQHVRFVHTKETPHSCVFCHKQFALYCGLQRHIRSHILERPFMCRLCSESFSHKSTSTAHERRHKRSLKT